ncbi:MAG TPA: alpha-glucosidase [Streptomyces sp.]|nr:alpha-glucosidase [Streptomyces sp.]
MTQPWWKSAVVYQIYPRSFADSNGDGVGDLRGILGRLDYLHDLGVDVLWLSPIHPSPQDDNGYDVSDYQDIDPAFGTLADFDELLAAVHERGMKLVMDLVVNHTSDEHPWFVESRDGGPEGPKRDWYWWRPAREGCTAGEPGAEPTNWGSAFSGPAWTYDEKSGEYYLHLFSRKQPDLNWENPRVRHAVYAMMNWWLDRGVDGFRMDVINLISKNPKLPDGPVEDGAPYAPGMPQCFDGPRLDEFLREMYQEVFADRPERFLTVGEMPGVTVDQARRHTDARGRQLDMVFQFEHMRLDHEGDKFAPTRLRLTDLKTTLGRWQTGLAEVGWNSLYWCNHDQPRIVSRFGDDSDETSRIRSATMLATVLHLHRGTPYVYQGEELGMTNAPFTGIDDYRDVESLNHYAHAVAAGAQPGAVLAGLRRMSRDHARTPMQWTAGPNAGFTDGEPWIAVHPGHTQVNAEAALADDASVYHHYRRLIALRHTEPAVVHGDFRMLLPDDERIYAFTRRHEPDGVELLVLGNFTGEATDVVVPQDWAGAALLLGNLGDGQGPVPQDATLTLQPWEARVHRRVRQAR